jgi:hypothetical protein
MHKHPGWVGKFLPSFHYLGNPLSWSPDSPQVLLFGPRESGFVVIEPAVRVSKLELRLMDKGGGTGFLHSTVLESLGFILLNRIESKVIFLFYKSMLNLAPLASLLLHLNHNIWACSTTNITKLCISLHLYCFAWKWQCPWMIFTNWILRRKGLAEQLCKE